MSSEESEDEWEDVPLESIDSTYQQEPSDRGNGGQEGSLEIVVASASVKNKGKSKLSDAIRKALAAAERDQYRHTHQVNLLFLIAHGLCLSRLCSSHALQALVLSSLGVDAPGLVLDSPEGYTKGFLTRLVKWVQTKGNEMMDAVGREMTRLKEDGDEEVKEEWRNLTLLSRAMLLVSILRVLGLRGRLVRVLAPLRPLKPPPSQSQGDGSRKGGGGKGTKKGSSGGGEGSGCGVGGAESVGGGQGSERVGLGERLLKFNIEQERKEKEKSEGGLAQAGKGKRRQQKKKGSGEKMTVEDVKLGSKKGKKSSKRSTSKLKSPEMDRYSDDEDFEPVLVKKRKKITHVAPPSKKMKFDRSKRNESVGKSSTEGSTPHDERVANEGCGLSEEVELVEVEETGSWTEVYVPGMKKWACLHLSSCSVDQPKLCEKHCSLPLHYVLAFEHGSGIPGRGYVTDVTGRYTSSWATSVRKHRVDEGWWVDSLRPYRPLNMVEIMEENEDMAARLSAKCLPLSVSEYKNHPLYILERHLLKFEVLYPRDCEVVGHCRGEAVYSRKNVHVLHTRETWLKEGRMVRLGEEPYSTVKSRPKRGQLSDASLRSEVFGRWQTEDYMPPIVVDLGQTGEKVFTPTVLSSNGKVPRNEYGNVDMYKPSMLPVGASHIKVPGVAKVARKLGIDCAPAVVGFEFHGGHSHPILDGVIVPEETADVLLEAWEVEQQIAMEKDRSKREKKVLGLWRKLTRAVLIRHRVQEQFDNINS